jgi:mRNA-degrading endonuclease toxin of MazEF toxin-antitoxin module
VAKGIIRGDVRLYSFAPPDKKRPVVVLTRDSAIAYLSTVTVAPSLRQSAACHPRFS